jgi:UrcA family protein
MNVHHTKTRILGSVLACAGTLGLVLTANAGDVKPRDAVPKHDDVVVRFADLNLNTNEGARVLYARLSVAAERACGDEPSSRELGARSYFQACYDRTLQKAVDKVSSPGVQALHAVRKDGAKVG